MTMRVDNEKRRERLRSKNEWLRNSLDDVCPLFPDAHRFEYNDAYDFWRAGYYGNTRKMLRDYEAIKDIKLGSQYELLIDGRYIYIRQPSAHFKNQYETLIANTPMDAPLESEQILSLRDNHPEIGFVSGTFAATLKSHLHTCHEKALMLSLGQFYRDELGPLGYSVKMFLKGRGRDMDYSIVLTHDTETPDACIQRLVDDGFTPYRSAKEKPMPEVDQAALAAREQELLKELEAVRKKLAI